jgi:protein-tyrosine phosphatase
MTAPSVHDDASLPAPAVRPGNPPYRVCFVCTGNICRSPMAASVFRSRVDEAGLTDRVRVDSAGTGAWHEGDAADHRTVAVLTANGYEEEHIARQFQAGWFADLDLIIALDEGHVRALRHLAPSEGDAGKVRLLRSYDPDAADGDLDVPDPYYGGMDSFELCLDLIEAASDGLLEAVRTALDGDGTPAPAAP